MKKKTALLIGAAAAAGLYSAIKGRGPFNGIKRIGRPRIILYVNRDGNGNFIFTECETANS